MTTTPTSSTPSTPSPPADHDPATAPTPRLRRRLAAFLYEGVVLFGVLMLAGYLFSALTQQHHAMKGREGMQAFLFLILGIYFIWFWSHGGQTVAMKTWHVRVVCRDGQPLSQRQALGRYLLSWLWFLPALGLAHVMHWQGSGALFGAMTGGAFAYAMLALAMPDRQFLHDRLCDTKLIAWDARAIRDAKLAAARI